MIEITLTSDEREFLQKFVKTGIKNARSIARANVLLFADEGYSNEEISKMTNVHRQGIWRIKKRYVDEGFEWILKDKPRSGQPRKYTDKQEVEIIALACTDPPKGRKRWTIRLITEHLKKHKGFETINRETVRLTLKKQKQNLG
jgi:transposase